MHPQHASLQLMLHNSIALLPKTYLPNQMDLYKVLLAREKEKAY